MSDVMGISSDISHQQSQQGHRGILTSVQTESAYKWLWFGLAILWLVDGLLQAQPAMFAPAFYAILPPTLMEGILQQILDGQPAWFGWLLQEGLKIWALHPILFNVCAIAIQLFISAALFFGYKKKLGRLGLWVSVVWGIFVWVFGEGMGGILTGSANYFDGAPGPLVFYVLAAMILLAPFTWWQHGTIRGIIRYGGGIFWFVMALLQLLPSTGFWDPNGIMSQFANAAAVPQPRFLQVPIEGFSLMVYQNPVFWNSFFVAIMIGFGVWMIIAKRIDLFISLNLIWLFWTWWFGQDFGGVIGGDSTDPSSAIVIGLIMITSWMLTREKRLLKSND